MHLLITKTTCVPSDHGKLWVLQREHQGLSNMDIPLLCWKFCFLDPAFEQPFLEDADPDLNIHDQQE